MKRLLLLLLTWCTLCSAECFSQIGDVWAVYNRVAQIEGSEKQLANYLKVLPGKADRMYAFLFKPMECPRCEFEINIWFRMLKELDPKAELTLIAVYPDREAAENYVTMRGFEYTSCIVDTTNTYKSIFSFSTGEPKVTYLMKIDRRNGRMIIGGDFSVVNPQTAKELHELNQPLPFYAGQWKENIASKPKASSLANPTHLAEPIHIATLEQHPNNPISTTFSASLRNGMLTFTDDLTNKVYLYEVNLTQQTAPFISSYEVNSTEEMLFVDTTIVPTSKFMQMKDSYEVLAMCLTSKMLNDTTLSFSVSLPMLIADEEPDAIAYYNKPAIVMCDKAGNSRKLHPLNFIDPKTAIADVYFTGHERYCYVPSLCVFLFPLQKGWPGIGLVEKDKVDIPDEQNSFLESFYNHAPIFALYDTNGELVKRFGQLDSIYRQTKTGYSYLSPVMFATNDTIVTSCGTSGIVHLYKLDNTDSPFLSIAVFEPEVNTHIDNSLEYKLEYLTQFQEMFSNEIKDVFISDSTVYCLSTEHDNLFLKQYDLKGKLIDSKVLNKEPNGTSIEEVGIYKIEGNVGAFGIFKDAKLAKIALY